MKKTSAFLPATLIAMLALAAIGTASSQESETIKFARALLDPSVNPTVTVGRVVHVELGMMGQNDDEASIAGVVVDRSGLIVVSRSALNPHGYEPVSFEAGPGMEITVEAEITAIWIQFSDGTRFDAEVVLTDPDLGLSLIRPIKAEDQGSSRFNAVKLLATASEPSVLDTTIVLSRLGEDVGWAPSVRLKRIAAILDSPWRCYSVEGSLGDVVFAADGRLLGIMTNVPAAEGSQAAGMMGPMGGAKGASVVLPVSQFRSLIEQVRGTSDVENSPAHQDEDEQASADPFHAPRQLLADGRPILMKDHGFTAPAVADVNDDGLDDLVVGWYSYSMKTASGSQKGNLYINEGTTGSPRYGEPKPIRIGDSELFRDTY